MINWNVLKRVIILCEFDIRNPVEWLMVQPIYQFSWSPMSNTPDMTDVFYFIDEFCAKFCPWWQKQLLTVGSIHRQRKSRMSVSEILTLMVMFHYSSYRTFKAYYLNYVLIPLRREFPHLVSYTRCIEFMKSVAVPAYVLALASLDKPTGVSFLTPPI